MAKFLVIQTAFIGDVILATPVIEKINTCFPGSKIDFLLRKGNERLLDNHPIINKLYIWDKKKGKYKNLFSLLRQIRAEQYDYVINLQRFFSTGILTAFSKATNKIGFSKNPLSVFFTRTYSHTIDVNEGRTHEVDRNLVLISDLTKSTGRVLPKLYPAKADLEMAPQTDYVTISPTSVWFTKQFPAENWVRVINQIPEKYTVYLLGGPADFEACEKIKSAITSGIKVENMAGRLSFLQSAAFIKFAAMNYVNDSAPLHIASSMNAPVTAVFCSTTPKFGFGPLSDNSRVVESEIPLSCKPCGLHGYKACPQGHFKCSIIDATRVMGQL